MLNLKVRRDLQSSATSQLSKAMGERKWMSASWSITPEGKIHLEKTTYDFPHDDHQKALEMLGTLLAKDRESTKSVPLEPLPLAPHLAEEERTCQSETGLEVSEE